MAVPGRISAGRAGPAENALLPDTKVRNRMTLKTHSGLERENKGDGTRSALAKGQLDMSAITSAKSKLGFVGIGYMGRPIAQRLLISGFRLTAYDRRRTKAEELIRMAALSRKT